MKDGLLYVDASGIIGWTIPPPASCATPRDVPLETAFPAWDSFSRHARLREIQGEVRKCAAFPSPSRAGSRQRDRGGRRHPSRTWTRSSSSKRHIRKS
ncbi:MAG: hypothetical protein ACLR0N_09400 [Bilophila wadsworthia]